MDKPETTAPEAAAVPEAPPAAPAPVKAAPATEVTTGVSGAPAGPARAKSEKALRLAKALRDNLRRRKVAAKPARPSN
ncbi:hypothetical protein [Brevundimonas sp.]|uniref:hypothetical protein n=1 Tax=Brevundimonas sp. TaxID=1871086 RepID=UPI0025BBEDDC|nr:hypothetical protein [Brevundimonas sp.]